MQRIDLNLLLVFDAMLHDRSVTKAAARLGLSQPAMSHALNRLRHLLQDRLFVRTPDGMIPTPRAERLAEPVRSALAELRRALSAEEFLPERSQAAFTIAVNNFAAIVLVAPILARVRATAPGIRLRFRPSGTLDVATMLDRAELDIALLARPPALGRFAARDLIRTDYVGIVRTGHPALGRPLGMAGLAALQRLVISSSGDDLGLLDAQLAAEAAALPDPVEVPYLSAGPALIQSDMIALMGRPIADEFQRAYPVAQIALPAQPAPLANGMAWHGRFSDQPSHLWLRTTIASVAAEIQQRIGGRE